MYKERSVKHRERILAMKHPVKESSTNRYAETERVFSSDVIDTIETLTDSPWGRRGDAGSPTSKQSLAFCFTRIARLTCSASV
jgi:hypothetical protein